MRMRLFVFKEFARALHTYTLLYIHRARMSSGPAPQLTAEGGDQLQQGITLLLSRWSALELAVQNEWGGRDSRRKAQQLAVDIFSWFTQSKEPLYIDDLENLLEECMLTLNTQLEDGSIEEIAEELMIMHEECLKGDFQSIQRLKDSYRPARGVVHTRQQGDNDSDNDDDDESVEKDESSKMAVDAPKSRSNLTNSNEEMMVDEPMANGTAETDGWTVVTTKRSKGRKN